MSSILGRAIPGADSIDARRRGEGWREWREYLPCARLKLLVTPWHWRMRPYFWLDDLSFSFSVRWLFIEIEVYA